MRLILMGTGPFGVPTFLQLYASHHSITAVVTRPQKHRRGRGTAFVNPVRNLALETGTPILAPHDVNAADSLAALQALESDLLVVCDYGRILSADVLAAARLGGINLHASLLPRYRGAAPINWAIYRGETQTGVSVIHMTPKLDAGPVIAQAATSIDPDETAEALEYRLSELGAPLMVEAIDALEAGRARPMKQDPALASNARRLRKTDGLIDWHRPAFGIRNHVRAMQPWPGTYTFWHRPDGTPLRLILGPVEVEETPEARAAPGTILEAEGERLLVGTGQDACLLSTVQPAGKGILTAGAFLRGYRLEAGERFVDG